MTFGITFKLTPNDNGFDIGFDDVEMLEMIDNSEKAGQDLTVLFKTQVGEDPFNLSFGTSWDILIGSNTPDAVIEAILLDALTKYVYFREIILINIIDRDYVNRTMTVELSVRVQEEIVNTLVVI